MHRPLVISHRGTSPAAPGNTLETFEQAVRLGVDGIETDVRRSADGHAVLFHDRRAPDGRDVATLSRDELSRSCGYHVPLLHDVLQAWDHVLWVVEIKTPDALEATLATLRRFHTKRRLLVISFWHDVIQRLREQLEVPTGITFDHRPLDFGRAVASGALPRDCTATVWFYERLDAELVADVHTHGLRCFVYGAETPAEHDRCVQLEVDGVITDDPADLLEKRRQSGDDLTAPAPRSPP